jgi:hypothetical protein
MLAGRKRGTAKWLVTSLVDDELHDRGSVREAKFNCEDQHVEL